MSDLTFQIPNAPIGCKTPNHVLAQLSEWPDGKITWAITDIVPGITEEQLRDAVNWSWAQWEKVCGIQATELTDANKARVLITCRTIDGPGMVLAETELPSGAPHVRMWLDRGDTWDTGIPMAIRAIIMADVIWHELGHALGLGHAPDGSANIMAPIYNPATKVSGSWDIQQSQSRYGPPLNTPPIPPTNPTIPVPPIPSTPGGSPMGFLATLLKFFSTIDPTTLSNIINLIKTFTTAFGQLPKAQQQQLLEALHAETGDVIQALKAAP